ncbi:PTS sugar transporter subunit IIA [Zhaonella formicivorans]|uniref:PTS sugar transporter subunit IIA n=1 Tax=Zhaonella formicivorans TaxID=2528593 RepID=UPI001D0FC0BD|nr:PTS mannose transporter subunit IIAB [Zhaonella formicivorans]
MLVVTHGDFGAELIKSAEIIIGKQPRIAALGLHPNNSVADLQKAILEKVTTLDEGEGVIILTDIFGGSTSNSVALALRKHKYSCLTGVNLPILIEAALNADSCTLPELTQKCLAAGKEGIKDLVEAITKEETV